MNDNTIENDNAIERLKNRQRPKVDKRDTSLGFNEDLNSSNFETNSNFNISEFSNSVIVSNNKDEFGYSLDLDKEPIRRSIRLTPEIDENIERLCRDNKITRDTFLEACAIVCPSNQSMMKKVIKEARERYRERKRIGELKKLRTMKQKLE